MDRQGVLPALLGTAFLHAHNRPPEMPFPHRPAADGGPHCTAPQRRTAPRNTQARATQTGTPAHQLLTHTLASKTSRVDAPERTIKRPKHLKKIGSAKSEDSFCTAQRLNQPARCFSSTSRKRASHAGCAVHAGPVTSLPSTTASEKSTTSNAPPASSTSGAHAG